MWVHVTAHNDDDGIPSGETVTNSVQHPDGSTDTQTNEFDSKGNIKSSTATTTSPAGVLMTSVTTTADGKSKDNMTADEKTKAQADGAGPDYDPRLPSFFPFTHR
jgi:hypothetical protein